jgi:hypothetical protein
VAEEVFIYYRIAAVDERAVAGEVLKFQRSLCGRFPGLRARLLRRRDEGVDKLTLMEVYAGGQSDGLAGSGGLLAAIDQAAGVIRPTVIGERHVEVFEPCA